MHKRKMSLLTLVMSVVLLFSIMTQAQGGILSYGMTVPDKLDNTVPQVLYIFNGVANDVVTIYALGWANDFQPTLTLLGGAGQLGFSNQDPLTPMSNDARITARLPQDGTYSILVGSANGVFNSYTVSLQVSPPVASQFLANDPTEVFVSPQTPPQSYSLPLSPDSTQVISVQASPNLPLSVQVRDANGNVIASIGGLLPAVSFALPAGSGNYELIINSPDATSTGSVTISRGGTTGAGTSSSAPATTNTVGVAPENICAVFAAVAGGVNLRSGPSTDYATIGSLIGNEYVTATGFANGWYTGTYRGQTVWVSANTSITIAQGASCASLPTVQPPPLPVVQSTPTPTATTGGNQNQPTPTATATLDQNQPTPTPTNTALPQEFPSSPTQFSFVIQQNVNDAQIFNNTISSPGWHLVRVSIDGITNQGANSTKQVNFVLTCNATNLTWGTAGANAPTNNVCNGSTSNFFGFDSNQFSFFIRVESGSSVSYSIIATGG